MQLVMCLLVLVTLVASDSTLQGSGTTTTTAVEPYDLASDIASFTSAIAEPTRFLSSIEALKMDFFVYLFDSMTASAASFSSSMSPQLSTADATASASIQSQLSQVQANVSRASSALQAAQLAVNSTSSGTSSSTGGVGCVQTAAVGMGALVGGMAALVHL